MTLLFEHMIKVETETHVCRIWRQERDLSYNWPYLGIDDDDLKLLAAEIIKKNGINKAVLSALVEVSRVNSVEVVDRLTGCGICVHKDWP